MGTAQLILAIVAAMALFTLLVIGGARAESHRRGYRRVHSGAGGNTFVTGSEGAGLPIDGGHHHGHHGHHGHGHHGYSHDAGHSHGGDFGGHHGGDCGGHCGDCGGGHH